MTKEKIQGRPRAYTAQDAPMRIFAVRMTEWHARKARLHGGGSLSLGVRDGIEAAEIARQTVNNDDNI